MNQKQDDSQLNLGELTGTGENHPPDQMASHDPAAAARAQIESLGDPHQSPHPATGKQDTRIDSRGASKQSSTPDPQLLHSPATFKRHGSGLPAEWVLGRRKLTPLPGRARPILSALAAFMFLLVIFKADIIVSQVKYWTAGSPQAPAENTAVAQAGERVSSDPLIEIPKIDVRAPIVFEPSIAEPAVQKALQKGVVHYGTSVRPGEPGNTVIVGHSSNDWWEPGDYKFVFVLLDKLVVGDRFSINYDSTRYVYEVSGTKVVSPTDLSVLEPTPTPTVTLITCTPAGTNWRRLIITAKQVSPAPETTHVADAPFEIDVAKLPSNAPTLVDQMRRVFGDIWERFGTRAI